MKSRYVTVVGLSLLVACASTDTTDPNAVRVASVSYSDTACGAASCNGVLRFHLVNSTGDGRSGLVQIGSQGVEPYMSVWTNADGWQQMAWTVDLSSRPYTITACPQGLIAGDPRCASTSTG